MTDREAPRLDARRADDFRAELGERARAWVRDWNVGEARGGFGAALLDVAARFSAQVAERLDRAGEKLSLGLLDWLALRGKAARPARMPVAFRLADNAVEPVLALHPVRLQADADGASVVFETESDVKLVPGRLDLLVGIDAPGDHYFLPPGGLSSLDPLEPLPVRWRTIAFAGAGATHIQLDPPLGLAPDMLIGIAGRQYRIEAVDGGLVKLDPTVDAAGGIAPGSEVDKVASFDPFGAAVRNQQRHYVYLGDDDLFNIDAAAVIEIAGADAQLAGATWQYFGAGAVDDTPAWRTLEPVPAGAQGAGKLVLRKDKGSVMPTQVGQGPATRWIRAGQEKVERADILNTEKLTVVVNPGAATLPCRANGTELQPEAEAGAEGFANTTPLAFTSAFYPLGRAPKQFDAFYLGSSDAFTKKGADVAICFEMSNPAANAFAAMREGPFANRLLAGVGGDGALHLLAVDGSTGALSRFGNREPTQPRSQRGAAVLLDTSARYRPPMWAAEEALPGVFPPFLSNTFYVAVAAGTSVWVRKEVPLVAMFSSWIDFGTLPAPPGATRIDGLVYLRDGDDTAAALLFAACGGKLFRHSAVAKPAPEPWTEVTLANVPVSASVPPDPYRLSALAPIDSMPAAGRWHGAIADGLVGVFANQAKSLVYFVKAGGACIPLDNALPAAAGSRPAAVHVGAAIYVFWQLESMVEVPPATTRVFLHVAQVDAANLAHHVADFDTAPEPGGPSVIAGGQLEIAPSNAAVSMVAVGTRDNASWILSWSPFGTAATRFFETRLPDGVGPLGGAPTLLDRFIVAPGTRSDAWSASWDASLRREFAVTLQSGIVVPATLAPAIAHHDFVGIATPPSSLERAEVGALVFTRNAERFHSLDKEFGIGSAGRQLLLFRHASAAGVASTFVSDTKMMGTPGDGMAENDWLLVAGTSYLRFRQVKQINAGPEIELKIGGNPPLPPGALEYWRAEPIEGRAAPFMTLDPNTAGAWDAKLLDHVRLTFTGRQPATQSASPYSTTAAGRPELVVLDKPWSTGAGDGASTCSFDAAIGAWARQLSETSTDPKLIWEYWSGRAWEELAVTDETEDLKVTGRLEFKVPATLAATDVGGKTNHWIRARLIEGDYGHEVVTVLTQPHPTIANATVQEVKHDTNDFHPPLVVNMRIRYSVTGALPAYLLTQDGGSLRDQSDANRTPGTFVEAFVPLGVQFERLQHAGTDSLPKAGVSSADCGCNAVEPARLSTAERAAQAEADPVTQSIMLGFSAGLLGEPINVLLLVEERDHDAFAPLTVEALVNDRFEPVVVRDTTRALGESGLLSMAFPVQPSPRELFGRSLSWLRLRPSRPDPDGNWKPVIRGAYLNATWASATETLTREPLGSSDGRPHLAVQVARPPLLQDTLELRVREPLDDEERQQLLDADANAVKSNEPDLAGNWVLWKQVADPDDAGPHERVYALDEETGEIRFGDGLHGMIPAIGRDSVVAFSYQRTEPAADGGESVPANSVAARTALQLVTPVESVEAAFAADRAAGGAPPEPNARVQRFASARLRHRERAVSRSDFEDLALQSSPDISQARAFGTSNGLRLVVVMRGPQPTPDAPQRRELERLLQRAATPLLRVPGALTIAGPKVRRLRLNLTLRVESLDDAGRLGADAKRLLARFFDSATGGVSGSGWPLGLEPSDDDIAFALESARDLAGIEDIARVEIGAQGNVLPWRQGLRRDELVMLAVDPLRIQFKPLELQA